MLHKDFLDRVSVDFAWGLIESFKTQPREAPEDANRGAELIAERLKSAGIPVTMHRPTLFLSLPGPASVEIGGQRFRAKPPAFSASVPQGVTAPMEYFAPTKREYARHQKPRPHTPPSNGRAIGLHLRRGTGRPSPGRSSSPRRSRPTACTTAFATLRASAWTASSRSSASWLFQYGS